MEDQDEWCNLIALSVGSVMRQSLDTNFKEECKKLVGATNTKMVEEILYEKLTKKIQTGSRDTTQQQPPSMNPSTSSVVQEKPLRSQNLASTTNSTIATSARATITTTQRNMQMGELYRRTILKRNLSPQPAAELESKLKQWRGPQNSAPF